MNKKQFVITVAITAMIAILATTIFYVTPIGKDIYSYVTYRISGSPASKLLRIEALMDRYFMGDYSKSYMTKQAAMSFVSGACEKYTSYLPEDVYKQMQESLDGHYVGIGVGIMLKNNEFVIESVTTGSPAHKAGLVKGDIIVSVNGKEYLPSQLQTLSADIRNTPSGKSTNIGIKRDGVVSVFEVVVDDLNLEYVTEKMLDENIGYIRIETFGNKVAERFEESLEKLQKQGMKSLIIDVRSNPGGSLDTVVDICDTLLPEGVITTVKDKNGKEDVYKSDADCINVPMCVLINSESASASEILAASLKEYKKATLVGEKTYGKGVVQGVFDLRDGSGLRITIAKYFTPSGVCIDKTGVEPDVEVLLPEGTTFQSLEDEGLADPQMEKAIEILKIS
ncbi:MAG: S41 family peptidase [Ruminococcaceae bacterium]|nr:S41 family peptidase [Oscillospiraceae bacterium]